MQDQSNKRPSLTLEKTGTPGIYRRHAAKCSRKGRCTCPYVVITAHRGKQAKTFHRTLELAREAKGDRTRSDRQVPQSRRPFDDYAREWVANCQGRTARGFDEDTRKSYARSLELYAIPHFGSTALRDITRRDLDRYITALQRKELSSGTIAKYVAPIRALFSDAVERGDVSVNPALKLRINAKTTKRDRAGNEPEREKVLTRAELDAILAAIPPQHRLVFELMAGTGCRISEALGLDWSDLETRGDQTTLRIERQWYRGTLKPNTKTEAGQRTVELSPGLASRLWEAGADRTGPILHTRTGRRMSDRNLRRVLDSAAAAAGIVGVSHHTFRHTHGSILLDQGWSIPEVSKRLGHANPQITAQVYSHAMRDRSRGLDFLDTVAPAQYEEVQR